MHSMKVSSAPRRPTRVVLPPDVQRPFEVFVNGVLQVEGGDYVVRDGSLEFARVLKQEGKLGVGRWTSMIFGVAGSYRQNDSVDVTYERSGRRMVAAKLPIDQA